MGETNKRERFERTILPHLDAAFNLARWLARGEQDAEDLVQEAYLCAFAFFDGFHGEDGQAWMLAILRNTCYTWLRKNRVQDLMMAFEEEVHSGVVEPASPETLELRAAQAMALRQALEELPAEFREVLVLRELEGLSYKEISSITGMPIGAVMSRLARARNRLQQRVLGAAGGER